MDTDYGQASLEVGGAYLTTVAIDCLLALVSAFEKLTDLAVEDTPSTPKPGERYVFAPCTAVQCCALKDHVSAWKLRMCLLLWRTKMLCPVHHPHCNSM